MPTCTSSGGGRASSRAGGGTAIERSFSKAEQSLIKGLPENERKDFYYSRNENQHNIDVVNNGTMSTQFITDRLNNYYVQINESLPQLEGSPKQVAWAEDIRRKQISQQVDRIVKRMDGASKQQRESAYEQVGVSNLNDFVNAVVTKLDTNGAMMKIKKQKSAKAIIDSR